MKNSPNNVLLQSFVRLAADDPGLPALVSPSRTLTRGQVDVAARSLAERLAELGDLQGRPLLLVAPNGGSFLAGLLAAWMRGALPILADHASPSSERLGIARRLGAVATLESDAAWEIGPDSWSVRGCEEARDAGPRWPPGVIKLSSGSTGGPRGILVRDEALAADDRQLRSVMGIERSERLLVAIPLSHSYGMGSLAAPLLSEGLALVLSDPDAGLFGPLEAARAERAQVFPTVPAYLRALLDLPDAPAWPPTLRLVVTAGAPLSAETARRFRERFSRSVHVFYGASETGGISYDTSGGAGERGAVGVPIPGVSVTLEGAQMDAEGNSGEGRVVVRSPALAERYLPDDDERLSGGRFLAGDIARFESGELCIVGRIDDLVNVRGKKVNPREVEALLAGHPAVAEAVVVGVDDPASGTARLRAVVTARGEPPRHRELADWCRARVAPHKVPRSILVVDAIPRTARGKVDRNALKRLDGESS